MIFSRNSKSAQMRRSLLRDAAFPLTHAYAYPWTFSEFSSSWYSLVDHDVESRVIKPSVFFKSDSYKQLCGVWKRKTCQHNSTQYNTTIGRRSFPVAASIVWNSLPVHIQTSPSLTTLRQRLKTFLFQQSFPDIVIWHRCTTSCATVDFVMSFQVALKALIDMIDIDIDVQTKTISAQTNQVRCVGANANPLGDCDLLSGRGFNSIKLVYSLSRPDGQRSINSQRL